MLNYKKKKTSIDDGKITISSGCKTTKYILSNESLTNSICYFEIKKFHNSGCYDSFGVCTIKTD